MRLQPGYYLYLGSALGPGGLRARIAHHQKPSFRPHWHIDYLRAHTRLERIWYSYGAQRREHLWAEAMQAAPGASAPLRGFGASDCACESHLFFLQKPLSLRAFAARLRLLSTGEQSNQQTQRGLPGFEMKRTGGR